jgi:hypothetical protein
VRLPWRSLCAARIVAAPTWVSPVIELTGVVSSSSSTTVIMRASVSASRPAAGLPGVGGEVALNF